MKARASNAALTPPIPTTDAGELRRVGVEIELGGLDLEQIADEVVWVLGGQCERETDYEYRIEHPRYGAFRVEADLLLLQRIGRRREEQGATALGKAAQHAVAAVAAVAEMVAPFEVITPPLPIDALPRLDELVARLRERGATGSDDSVLRPLSLQLNPEAPSLRADSVLAYLRAFSLLNDWLRAREPLALSRRLTWFVDPYPASYVRRVLDADYAPSIEQLIDDYCDANRTRNRDLDLMPLLAHIDEARVRAVLDDPLIKPRPAYHYRLPTSHIGNAGWGDAGWKVTDEWRRWLVVERLAADPVRLRSMADEYLAILDRSFAQAIAEGHTVATTWAARCDELVAVR